MTWGFVETFRSVKISWWKIKLDQKIIIEPPDINGIDHLVLISCIIIYANSIQFSSFAKFIVMTSILIIHELEQLQRTRQIAYHTHNFLIN